MGVSARCLTKPTSAINIPTAVSALATQVVSTAMPMAMALATQAVSTAMAMAMVSPTGHTRQWPAVITKFCRWATPNTKPLQSSASNRMGFSNCAPVQHGWQGGYAGRYHGANGCPVWADPAGKAHYGTGSSAQRIRGGGSGHHGWHQNMAYEVLSRPSEAFDRPEEATADE